MCKKHSNVSMHISTPNVKAKKTRNNIQNYIKGYKVDRTYSDTSSPWVLHLKGNHFDLIKEDLGQLRMGE